MNQTDLLKRAFNDAAKRYQKAFPTVLKNLIVSFGDETLYVSPEIADRLTANIAGVKKMLAARAKWMLDNGAPAAAGVEVVTSGFPVRHVSFDDKTVPHLYVSWRFPERLNFITLLDHEIGHLVVEKAAASRTGIPVHVKECAADAYASLRHFQRFGTNTDFSDFAPTNLALQATLLESKHHYTSAVVMAVIDMYRQSPSKIRDLSLTEMAELAGDLAFKHTLKPEVLRKVENAFAPARVLYKQEPMDWKKVLAAIVDVVRANPDDADIRTAGILSVKRSDLWKLVSEADQTFITGLEKLNPLQQAPIQTAKTQISPR